MSSEEHIFNEDNHTGYELLMDWNSGLLSEETGEEIKRHLDSCERCSMIYEGLHSIQDTAQSNESHFLNEAREKQQQLLETLSNEQNKSRTYIPWKIGLSIAASITLLIVVSTFILSGSKNSEELVLAYLEEGYRSPVVDRAGDTDSDMIKALDFYSAKDFEKAIPYFEEVVSLKENDFRALFYAAICYLQVEVPDTNKAIRYLSLVNGSQSRYKEQARWFLSLAHYLNNDQESARELLIEMTEKEDHFKKAEAIKLLKSL